MNKLTKSRPPNLLTNPKFPDYDSVWLNICQIKKVSAQFLPSLTSTGESLSYEQSSDKIA